MPILFFIISLLVILFAVLMFLYEDGDGVVFLLGSTILFFSVVGFYIIPYSKLNQDVNTIIHAQDYIEMERDYVADLNRRLNSLPNTDSALMNADTPVATLIQPITDTEQKIRNRKVDMMDAKRSIAAQRTGITGYIFWFYPDSKLEEANSVEID